MQLAPMLTRRCSGSRRRPCCYSSSAFTTRGTLSPITYSSADAGRERASGLGEAWKDACNGSVSEAGEFHPPGDVILNPVSVPPFLGVDLHAFELHAEVDVVAAGHAGVAAVTHDLSALDQVAFVNRERAQMAVDGLQSVAVVEHDAVAINAKRGGV